MYLLFVRHLVNDVDPEVLTTVAVNFFINANLIGWDKQEELRNNYNCNIPWAILLDPTSACNLHCTGCWAPEYGNKLNLSFDEIDDIICQGKEMGIYLYIYTGGEPLVCKKDIIKLCEKHNDCVFLCFTNGTLIDEAFADEMLRVKNIVPAISLEGFREATNSRRGNGVYERVIAAMNRLHERKLLYGISSCYTSVNWDSITSEEYYNGCIYCCMITGIVLKNVSSRGALCTAAGLAYPCTLFAVVMKIGVSEIWFETLTLACLSTWACDSFAMFGGQHFGKHAVAP